uniref:hypothetical protein n=1 Tax=Saccharibacillus sp. CPCC 101409 TaxID=3058041 RepID=UPI002673E3F6|nr:hypothetical protein [Saccharibacillus sp. CPCC 101409]
MQGFGRRAIRSSDKRRAAETRDERAGLRLLSVGGTGGTQGLANNGQKGLQKEIEE